MAYYQVLRTRALRKTAQDAVRRAEDDLDVAKKLEKGGALEKEKRLRVEVQLAESQRLLDAAEGAEASNELHQRAYAGEFPPSMSMDPRVLM